MKKILLVTLILTLLMALPALAEEGTTTVSVVEVNWNQDTMDAFVAAGFDGNMATITLKDGFQFQLLIPDGFEQRDLTAEEEEQGIELAVTNKETNSTFRIMNSTVEGLEDFDGLAQMAQHLVSLNPETAIQFASINGVPALISGLQAEDTVSIAFAPGGSRCVEIEFAPLEGNNQLVTFFMTSVQF